MYILIVIMLPLMILRDNEIQYALDMNLTEAQYTHFMREYRPVRLIGGFSVSIVALRSISMSAKKQFIDDTFRRNFPKYLSLDMPAKIDYREDRGLRKIFTYEISFSQLWIEPLEEFKDLYEEVYLKDVGWCYLYEDKRASLAARMYIYDSQRWDSLDTMRLANYFINTEE